MAYDYNVQHTEDPTRPGKGLCSRPWRRWSKWQPFVFPCEHCKRKARKLVWIPLP